MDNHQGRNELQDDRERDRRQAYYRRRQPRTACDVCRRRKVRCDLNEHPGRPCSVCRKLRRPCRTSIDGPPQSIASDQPTINTITSDPGQDASTQSAILNGGVVTPTSQPGQGSHAPPLSSQQDDQDAIEQDEAANSIQDRLAHARNCLSRFFGEGIAAQDWNLFDPEDSFRVAYTGTDVSNLAQLVRLHLALRTLPANSLSLSPNQMGTSVSQMHDYGWHGSGDARIEMMMPETARHYPYPPIRTLPQWSPAPESLAFSRDILADVSSFPAQEVRDALVKAYFDNVHPYFPIISQSAFMESYRNTQNPPQLLVFQAVLLAGAHSCTHPLVAKDRHAVKSVLFRRASMLYHLRHETDRAQLIQAAFLFTWHVSDGDTVASGPWYWSGVAARVGCGLGAHRKSSVLPPWVSSLYRRCWWVSFVSDVFSALETGRPCTVRAEDIDQVLMTAEEVTELHLPGAVSSDLDPRLHFLNRMVELALIGVDVLSANAPARTEPVDVDNITTRLGVWALQAGLSTASTDHDDSLSCMLRMHYNLMLLYFHRTMSTNATSQEICAVSAHGILISLEKIVAMGCIAQCPFTGVGAVAAVGIQTVNDIRTAIGKGGHLLAIESINRLSHLLRLLEKLAQYWPNAESVLTVFQRLHNECTSCISQALLGEDIAVPEDPTDWTTLLFGSSNPHLSEMNFQQSWLDVGNINEM